MDPPSDLKALAKVMNHVPATGACSQAYGVCNAEFWKSRATCDADARACYASAWAYKNACVSARALPDLQCKVGGTGAPGEIDCSAQALAVAFQDLSNTAQISKTDWTGAYEHVFGTHAPQDATAIRDHVCRVVADAYGKALQVQNYNLV